ncbi:hypothetical protein [Corynebacterium tapiri]|uniref:Uncharacterized protein n=1 Tax=Corynebacterium tapiri TaxID=1448266 RepID=A0A5C4U5K6_9CORY|nr:hypothetical protein [Corynebacterium tapiri]TNL99323.1 hypothetical protein FHE74_02910 [Corynebacterium tapiri]
MSASSPFADPTDSLLGWASQTELSLAGDIDAHPWFVTAGYTLDQLERIERLFGLFLVRQVAAGANLSELFAVTPALTSVSLISRAARLADSRQLNAEYLAGLGLQPTEANQQVVAEQGRAALQAVSLEHGDSSADMATVAALHAGITAAEVDELLTFLDANDAPAEEQVELIASGEAGEGMEDERALMLTSQVAQLDPERLGSLVMGINALREFSQQHPTSWLDRDFSHLPHRLPRLVEEAVVAELRERPVGTEDRSSAVGVAVRELRPRLIFDSRRGRVCLRLPEQRVGSAMGADPNAPEVSWRVSMAGTTRVYRTGRPWGEPTYAEALDVSLPRQVRELTVSDVTNSITWDVPVVNPDDPVLIFSAAGHNVTDKASLHHSELIVVAPSDASLICAVSSKKLPVLEEMPVAGWTGWSARRVDASRAASLQVLREGDAPSALQQLRSIDPRQRPRFVHPGQPVPNVLTHTHLPVHSESLVAQFPPTLSGTDELWQLSISAYSGVGETAEEIAEPEPLEVPAQGGDFVVFDPEAYDAPWVGEYLVRLKGPRNESFRHRYAIVEGMQASTHIDGPSSGQRIPSAGGLSRAELTVRPGEKDFEVTPRHIDVDPLDASADFTVGTDEGDVLPLRFTPPALQFELGVRQYPPMWRTSRVQLQPHSLDPDGSVRVRTPGVIKDAAISVRNQHGTPVATVKLKPEDSVTYSAPLKAITKYASVMATGRMELEWIDQYASKRASFTLATFTSQPKATGARIEGGQLVLEGFDDSQHSGAWLWPATAPWAMGRTLATVEEITPLPQDLVNAGDLIVQLHSADRFSVLRPPLKPHSSSLVAEQPGYLESQNDDLAHLSAFVAGELEGTPSARSVLPVIWDHFGSTPRERTVAQQVFQAQPAAALTGLSNSLVAAQRQPGRMIATGLVNVPFRGAGEEDLADSRAPWVTGLLLLGRMAETIESEAGAGELKSIMAEITQSVGKNLSSTLLTGRDSTLDTACIDASTVRISHMDPAQQEQLISMFFSSTEIVPGELMDDGSRLMAVFETYKKRELLNHIVADEGLIKSAVKLLRALNSKNKALYAAARVRFDKLDGVNTEDPQNAWSLAPVISLVFALAARMHAHGMMGKSATLDAAADGWSQLANECPDLVIGDILSADAMVLAAASAARR